MKKFILENLKNMIGYIFTTKTLLVSLGNFIKVIETHNGIKNKKSSLNKLQLNLDTLAYMNKKKELHEE